MSICEQLHGVHLPITTPFDLSGDLDLDALRSNIQRWTSTGISGLVVLGSTGDRVHLDEREYLEVIQTARNTAPDNMTFIVGAGQQSTRGTINEIRKAADAGVDAVLVITPHFYRSAITQDTLISYYEAVADSSAVPVI